MFCFLHFKYSLFVLHYSSNFMYHPLLCRMSPVHLSSFHNYTDITNWSTDLFSYSLYYLKTCSTPNLLTSQNSQIEPHYIQQPCTDWYCQFLLSCQWISHGSPSSQTTEILATYMTYLPAVIWGFGGFRSLQNEQLTSPTNTDYHANGFILNSSNIKHTSPTAPSQHSQASLNLLVTF